MRNNAKLPKFRHSAFDTIGVYFEEPFSRMVRSEGLLVFCAVIDWDIKNKFLFENFREEHLAGGGL